MTKAPGGTDLSDLIRSMAPRLLPGIHVFATVPHDHQATRTPHPLMVFRESEGTTLILAEAAAREAGLEASFRCRMITLNVHSSLEAVGFLAAITTHLAAAGIGVNPVSAFYHDHLFVPADRAEEAMAILSELAKHHRG